jgi:hypothetical protein
MRRWHSWYVPHLFDGATFGLTSALLANPPLTVTNTGSVTIGTQLQFASPALNDSVPSSVRNSPDPCHGEVITMAFVTYRTLLAK